MQFRIKEQAMSKIVVLAEKPSVGRDIARVLKCNKKIGNGALEGSAYIVTWGLGHLVELAPPERYDQKYKEWKMDVLPMIPEQWKLEVIGKTGKQFQMVKSQLMRADVNSVIIATDAGREGELVARWILKKSGCKKPIQRLWISSVTDKAIKEGFVNLHSGREYESLFLAAENRAKADWVVGMNATRALTCKYNAQLSCGRVQTPTLAMIAKRGEEIRAFKPELYYGCKAMLDHTTFVWQDKNRGGTRTFHREKMEDIVRGGKQAVAKVIDVQKADKSTQPPQLYDLTELQREANQKFDYSAKETLNIMQRLYENHKVLTYPRTDSRYLTQDIVSTIKERLDACGAGPYRGFAQVAKRKNLSGKLAFVDDKKVGDHHAIIPTESYVQLDHMTVDERRIYDLVVRRFMAVLHPGYEYEQTSILVEIQGETFKASGNVVKHKGWKTVYEGDVVEEYGDLSAAVRYKKGEEIPVSSIKVTEGKTTPPSYFNEGTLLSAMENPVKYMETHTKEDAKVLGETGGLGTVATRADIIEKLFQSFLIEKNGKELRVTAKGKQLLELVPEDLRKPELTASWEKKLSSIAKGTLRAEDFYGEILAYTDEIISEIKTGTGSFRHDNITREKCPDCGKFLLLVKGKRGTMKVCQDRACGYRETISRTSNARCPKCHKKLELRGKGENQQFVCATCGHKEKLASFTERRKKEGAGVSKKDIQKYMKKQECKEDVVNTAMGDLFQNIKL